MKFRRLFFVLMVAALPLALLAQQGSGMGAPPPQEPKQAPKERHVYKLDYTIVELENGKKTDSKDYTMLVDNTRVGRLRVGTRVPIQTGPQANVQYMDVGVNFDARVTDISETLVGVSTTADFTSVIAGPTAPAKEGDRSNYVGGGPILRSYRSENEMALPLGKQAVLFTADEPNSKRSFQILLTASAVR